MKKKPKKKIPRVGYGLFDFVNVALATAEGRLSMDAFANYICSMHPPKRKRRKKANGKR